MFIRFLPHRRVKEFSLSSLLEHEGFEHLNTDFEKNAMKNLDSGDKNKFCKNIYYPALPGFQNFRIPGIRDLEKFHPKRFGVRVRAKPNYLLGLKIFNSDIIKKKWL